MTTLSSSQVDTGEPSVPSSPAGASDPWSIHASSKYAAAFPETRTQITPPKNASAHRLLEPLRNLSTQKTDSPSPAEASNLDSSSIPLLRSLWPRSRPPGSPAILINPGVCAKKIQNVPVLTGASGGAGDTRTTCLPFLVALRKGATGVSTFVVVGSTVAAEILLLFRRVAGGALGLDEMGGVLSAWGPSAASWSLSNLRLWLAERKRRVAGFSARYRRSVRGM